MPASEAAYSGTSGGAFRLRVESSLLSQEISNNRSRVRIRAYMKKVGSSGVYNGYATSGYTEYNGGNRANHTMSSWGSGSGPWYLVSSRDVWVGHNSDGTKTVNIKAYHNGDNSPYLTTAATSHNYTLPRIDRYADITAFTIDQVTDVSFRVTVKTNVTCDYLDWSLNGSGWSSSNRVRSNQNFTSYTWTFGGNLASDTTFSFRVRVRRNDSGLWTESSTKSVTTLAQDSFAGVAEF